MFYLVIIVGLMFALFAINDNFFAASQRALNIVEALVRTERDRLDITSLEKIIRAVREIKTLIETYYERFNKVILVILIVIILLAFTICNYLY